MPSNKIIPNIWFKSEDGSISVVLKYYKNIFKSDFSEGQIISLGVTPGGYSEICEVKIFEQKYSFLITEKEHHPLNDAVSFIIYCENQKEIDKYWDYFTSEGEESQCGWCVDKYGLRWQVLIKNLSEIMAKPNAFEVMMSQRKIVIQEYLK
ncbi:MAG: VOC family protein [Bacteroidales bacterium]|nr:VOC family protein [Bacteroidales bacterium]